MVDSIPRRHSVSANSDNWRAYQIAGIPLKTDHPALIRDSLLEHFRVSRSGALTLLHPKNAAAVQAFTHGQGAYPNILDCVEHWVGLHNVGCVIREPFTESGSADYHYFGPHLAMCVNRDVQYGEGRPLIVRSSGYCALRLRLHGDLAEELSGEQKESHGANCSFINVMGHGGEWTVETQNAISAIVTVFDIEQLLLKTVGDAHEALKQLSFDDSSSSNELKYRSVPVSAPILQAAQDILNLDLDDPLYAVRAEAKTLQLLGAATAELGRVGEDYAEIHLRESEVDRLVQLKGRIERDFAEPLTVESLSRDIGMNPKKLNAGFRLLFNSSVHNYLVTQRMHRAGELLIKGNSVGFCAESVGYLDRSSFTKVFKKHFGVAPRDYRSR